ncbi:MAG TPA: PKD domain-containing protein [Solirubrobacteraceae bacterium]|nr:PKD domain-containing protein [Solirubrobacteraceae bacterium]
MPRLALAVLLVLAVAAVAGAQSLPTQKFAHDGTRDGTATEIHSGFWNGDPPSGDPLAARYANTYETFQVLVPDGTRHSRLESSIGWNEPRIDLDLSIYRLRSDGRPDGPAIARSAAKDRATERAVYAPAGATVAPGRYLVVVDNVCSRDNDEDPRTPNPADRANCGIGADVPDEDDFEGTVTLGNQAPQVTLTGPTSVPAKENATFRATASDPDGSIATYLFDLDGDGTYELDSDGIPEASATFPTRGRRTIGVQVLDDSGAAAFATWNVNVTRPIDTRPPLRTFRLSGPTFGGATKRALVITYRLREKARVEVKLRRGAGVGKLVRVIERGVRTRSRYHRIRVQPSHLRRGRYVVRIFVQGASGKRQVAQLAARRR